jgi:hypothetical protein
MSVDVDYILIEGQQSPGIALLPGGASSPKKWDEKKGYGTSGSTITYTGDGLAAFEVKIQLFTAQQWDVEWPAFRDLLRKPPQGQKPKALGIWHPILEEHEITSVVVEDVVGWVAALDGSAREWTVKFKQFRKPKAAVATPGGSSTSSGKAPAKSPADQIISDLTGQVNSLA